jgi:hypothetical protein
VWESTFVAACVFLGEEPEAALASLEPTAAQRVAPLARVLRSTSKIDRARAFAAEIDAVKRALDAMEPRWP